ncbi:MAG TPA: FmdE family protein [Chloroflexia bacterium]|nr:FmdE family protein [Chloroflexia bacterium]
MFETGAIELIDGLDGLLQQAAATHDHACPRQVLGVRMGMLAGRLFGLDLPQKDKRVFAFVETDGCFTDGVAVASGCYLGRRTMRLVDYGKVAVTFVDTLTERAVRVWPNPTARDRAWQYAPDEQDGWHAQFEGYKQMPTCELLLFEPVHLLVSIQEIVSKPGLRVECARCGEEIMNAREVLHEGAMLCKHCAGQGGYYSIDTEGGQ